MKKDLTKEIRKCMVDCGLDQKHLAKRLGIQESTMSYWITHPQSLTLDKFAQLNAVLHLPVDAFAAAGGFSK